MPDTEESTYTIIEGEDSKWTEGSDSTITVRADGDFAKFTGVKINDTLLDEKYYTAVSGSTIVTLKQEYLDTLEAGTYELTVEFTDGECSTDFEIKEKAETNPVPPSEPEQPADPKPPVNLRHQQIQEQEIILRPIQML